MIRHRGPRHRPYIQGLRAVAVSGVVLYHFGATWLPGGFVGVDIFFVISGFLISGSMYREIETGEFGLVDFYERRARRILPAFFVVTAVSSLAAYFLLFPNQLVSYAYSVAASALFGSNIYFYATANYFAPAASEIPLLHYWSLGVEEQFYLIFPMLVLALYRIKQSTVFPVICAMLVVSLVGCEIALRHSPQAAFYLLPFRAFEFLIGSALARREALVTANSLIATCTVSLGLLLIILSMVLMTERTSFPGFSALLPCAGTALVIWSSERFLTLPSRLLGARPIAAIGDISYSLYLVHWPVAVFVKIIFPDLSAMAFLIGGSLLSVALACPSYRYVEQPTRRTGRLQLRRPATFAISAAVTMLLCGASLATISEAGFPWRLDQEVNRILAYSQYDYKPEFREGTCFLRPEQSPSELDLRQCMPSGRPLVVLWGSSLIAEVYWSFKPRFEAIGFNLGQLTASACPSFLAIDRPGRPMCRPFNDFAAAQIVAAKPLLVVIGGDPLREDPDLAALERAVSLLTDSGIGVVMLGPWPFYKRPVPTILAERLTAANADTWSRGDLETWPFAIDSALESRFSKTLSYISPLKVGCPNGQCQMKPDGVPASFDDVHFTRAGADYYVSQMFERIAAVLAKR